MTVLIAIANASNGPCQLPDSECVDAATVVLPIIRGGHNAMLVMHGAIPLLSRARR